MKYLLPKRKRKRPKRVPKNKKNNLPKDVIDSWPEVFNNIEINKINQVVTSYTVEKHTLKSKQYLIF